jgi:hypothetical protein
MPSVVTLSPSRLLPAMLAVGLASAGATQAQEVPAKEIASFTTEVDDAIAAGPSQPLGIDDVHGLVRTAVVNGDYSDLPAQIGDGPEFGYSVAVQGDWLAVGAPGTRSNVVPINGAVFVFQRSAGHWQLRQRILGSGSAGTRCGHAVALRMPHLVVACPDVREGAAEPHGDVREYLFDAASNTFGDVRTYPGAAGDHCGDAIALSTNYLAIGCSGANEERGRVVIRRRNSVTGRFINVDGEVTFASINAGAAAGRALALYEPGLISVAPRRVRLAIGAPGLVYDGSIWPRGRVYMYSRQEDVAGWTLATALNPASIGSGDSALAAFGSAIALNTTQLVIGAPNNAVGSSGLPGPGTVHRFSRSNGSDTWTTEETGYPANVPNGLHAGMRGGAAVALAWEAMTLVGAPGTDGTYSNGNAAEGVGMVDVKRTASGDYSVFHYYGVVRPAPLSALARQNGGFGHAIAADVANRAVAVGYPYSGGALADTPTGAVWIYQPDALFADGFQP